MKTQKTFFKADQDRFGSIRIKKNSYIVKYLQFECEINWFFDQLENHEKNIINEGFEIDITNHDLLEILNNREQ